MRSAVVVLWCLCAALCVSAGCSQHHLRGPRSQRTVRSRPLPATPEDARDASELLAMLPLDADRCVVASPALVDAADFRGVSLISQLELLPWALNTRVTGYARAELQPSNDRRRVREYLRFADADRTRIRAELDKLLGPRVAWDGASPACSDELTCVLVQAQFIDDRTVMLATGEWPYGVSGRPHACRDLLVPVRGALEASARLEEFVGRVGEGRGSVVVLDVHGTQFVRTVRRIFSDEPTAEAALKRALAGAQDVPSLAGVAADATLSRTGAVVEQRFVGELEDLSMALADRERLRRAVLGGEEPVLAEAPVDVHDAEQVRLHVDQTLEALKGASDDDRERALAALDELLVKARAQHPHDEGLSRRHFALRKEQRHDACGAAHVAEERLALGVRNEAAWRLLQRGALSGCDEGRLRGELARAFELSAQESAHMASELVASVSAGQDYERAEWGYRTALELSRRGKRHRLFPASGRVPLALLPRVLAYLARLSDAHASQDLGVHILALADEPGSSEASDGVWMVETQAPGRHAVVLAAATWDEAQLAAEGRALSARFARGALEVSVDLEPIGEKAGGALVRLAGTVEHGDLVLDHASRSLSGARWELIARYLSHPLSHMVGAQFPPDELALLVNDEADVEAALTAVQVDRGMQCDVEGLALHCRGPLDDARAAARALVRVARGQLAREARALWQESD